MYQDMTLTVFLYFIKKAWHVGCLTTLACKDYAIDKPIRKYLMLLGRFGQKIMLPTNTLNTSVFFYMLIH